MKMGRDPILRTVATGAFFLVNVFAVYLLLRGHNAPGGGFIGGLATAISLMLLMLAFGPERAPRFLPIEPIKLAVVGLLLAVFSGWAPMLFGRPFLEQFTEYVDLPILGKTALGTPLLFDTGVFLLVVGIGAKLGFTLAHSTLLGRALSAEDQARFSSPLEAPIEDAVPEGSDSRDQEPRN
jgi:multicomponent Na+:H+ antiporter subunit B